MLEIGILFMSVIFFLIECFIVHTKARIFVIVLYALAITASVSSLYGWNIKINNHTNDEIKVMQKTTKYKVRLKDVKRVKDDGKETVIFTLVNVNKECFDESDNNFIKDSLPADKFDKFFGDNDYKTINRFALDTKENIVGFSYDYFIYANNHLKSDPINFCDVDNIDYKLEKRLNIDWLFIKSKDGKEYIEISPNTKYRYDYQGKTKFNDNEIKEYKKDIRKKIIKLDKKCNEILDKHSLQSNFKTLIIAFIIALIFGIIIVCIILIFEKYDNESE